MKHNHQIPKAPDWLSDAECFDWYLLTDCPACYDRIAPAIREQEPK